MAMPQGKTVWYICVADTPHRDSEPTEEQIDTFLRQYPMVANTREELLADTELAVHVVPDESVKGPTGAYHILAEVAPFCKQASDQGLGFRVYFISWNRAFWEIQKRYQMYAIDRNDVMIYQVPSSWCA